MHIGPLRGRDGELARVCKGILANPMNQPEASKVALITLAEFLADPSNYDPVRAWDHALREIGGDESYGAFRTFAENSLRSCLEPSAQARLEQVTQGALSILTVTGNVTDPSARALATYLTELDEACYHLKNRLDNLALRNDLLPWIARLELEAWIGQRALAVLESLTHNSLDEEALHFMREYAADARKHPKQIGGNAGELIASLVEQKVSGFHPMVR